MYSTWSLGNKLFGRESANRDHRSRAGANEGAEQMIDGAIERPNPSRGGRRTRETPVDASYNSSRSGARRAVNWTEFAFVRALPPPF